MRCSKSCRKRRLEYDLVIASDYILNTARLEGLMLPLDKEQLPNFANLDERFISQYFDRTTSTSCPT